MQPIKGHKYTDFIVSLSVQLYGQLHCGFRGVVKILSILKHTLDWQFPAVPSRNSIENWVKKSGYAIYNEPQQTGQSDDYALIMDESMMIGSEKLLLTLSLNAQKTGSTALTHQDVEVLTIGLKPSWNSEAILTHIHQSVTKRKADPCYIISDNAAPLSKAIRESGYTHIRDVGHTLGLFVERIYKKDAQFLGYLNEAALVRFRHLMSPVAYLLPPKQRTIARFLNLSSLIEWSTRLLREWPKLTTQERAIFSFVPRYASLIDELSQLLTYVNALQKAIKQGGISSQTPRLCQSLVSQHVSCYNQRSLRLIDQIGSYLLSESRKVTPGDSSWHASSDILESLFGVYKAKKSPNPLYGVTSLVLLLPLYSRIRPQWGRCGVDFKRSLETVLLSDIAQWARNNLTDNLVVKRNKTLKAS